ALQSRKGLIVVEGPSGMGKTFLLRKLMLAARKSRRVAVFVRAADCSGGVIPRLESILEVEPGSGLVELLVRTGSVHVYIDALNEAQPATVGEIARFCRLFLDGSVTLATQSLAWDCPAHAERYRLCPFNIKD